MCEKVYRQPPLRDSLRKGKLKKQEFSLTKQKAALLQAADSIGKKIQYKCPGFLPNKRQVIAYKYELVWEAYNEFWKLAMQNMLHFSWSKYSFWSILFQFICFEPNCNKNNLFALISF